MSLFDGAAGNPASSGPRRVTLVRLAGEIARSVAGLGSIEVEGEVHRPTKSKGGWTFFTLRDRAAQISVVVPRVVSQRSRIVGGERVVLSGRLEWGSERGQVSLRADEVMPVGEGAVAALIAETRDRLAADGLLDRPRRPLPRLPGCVGVLCGAEAAVRKDIESVITARFPGYPVVFEETTVSGSGAATSIVEGLRAIVRRGVDVVILARGGGDATSLLPWSSEEVCRKVAKCPIPVVSAIGHEGDRPLCDEVADLRCGTPSIAAAAVVPDRAELQAVLDGWRQRAEGVVQARMVAAGHRLASVDTSRALIAGAERASARLRRAEERLDSAHPGRQLVRSRERLGRVDWRRPTGELLGRAAGRLDAERRHLSALSPARTLERGYAVVTGRDGQVVRRAGAVRRGERIEVRLASGRLGAQVEEVVNE